MTSLLSRSQSSDFIRLEGLQKLTSVTAYDWDLYILKELIDNALDADESDASVQCPEIHVVMSYDMAFSQASGQLERSLYIEVSNQAAFPLERIRDLFDLKQRYSVKDYYKYPTRGAQGNALKTILGIPYALRYRYFADYQLDRIPMSISYGFDSHIVRLLVDELKQSVELDTENLKDGDGIARSKITVNIGRFTQDPPRKMQQLNELIDAIALLNPHASFHYELAFTNLDGQEEYSVREFEAQNSWQGKFDSKQATPIYWYRLDKFRELAFAVVRAQAGTMTIQNLADLFGIKELAKHPRFRTQTSLQDVVSQNDGLNELYFFLRQNTNLSRSINLGEVGREYILSRSALPEAEAGKEPLFFYKKYQTSQVDTDNPFVLELILAGNMLGKRLVITGINHTPTYTDPFFNKPLQPPDGSEPCTSLEKLMDYYDLREDVPVTLIVHLISPNIEYESYGKNAISDKPFRASLTQLFDEAVKEYKEATRLAEPMDYLTDAANSLIHGILHSLKGHDFSLLQLLYVFRRELMALGNPQIIDDLQSKTAMARLTAVVDAYQKNQAITGLYRRQSGRLAVPRYPNDTINIAFANMNILDIVREFHIRAIVVTNNPNIEDILIASRYPLRYDLAILRADSNLPSALALLMDKYQVVLSNINPEDDALLPSLWVVRDASVEAIRQSRISLMGLISKLDLDFEDIVDFGLDLDAAQSLAIPEAVSNRDELLLEKAVLKAEGFSQEEIEFFLERGLNAKLESLSPHLIQTWFESQLNNRGIPLKALPQAQILTSIALEELRKRFRAVIADLAFETFSLDRTQEKLIDLWRSDKPDWDVELYQHLEAHLAANPHDSWFDALQQALSDLLRRYLNVDRRTKIQAMMKD